MSAVAAFFAGLLSFFSPCIIPLLPAYLSYVLGIEHKEYKNLLAFIAGFSIVFIAMGASASLLGKIFIINRVFYRKASGILIVIFGLMIMDIIKIPFMQAEKKLFRYEGAGGLVSSFLLGISFSAGWTPCVGPILSSILMYAGMATTVYYGVMLLAFYSIGMALPFIILAIAINFMTINIKLFYPYMRYLRIGSGVIMILFGILTYFNAVEKITGLFL